MDEYERQQIEIARMKAVYQYVQALERGDLEGVAAVLEAALNDAELDRLLAEVERAYLEEQGLTPIAADAQLVRDLAREHLPSAFAEKEIVDTPLTVGEVADRLQSDRRVPSADQEANRRLRDSTVALPSWLSMQAIRKVANDIGVTASDQFWRIFRDTAITLGMGRSHSQAQWAAAREARARYEVPADATGPATKIASAAEEQSE